MTATRIYIRDKCKVTIEQFMKRYPYMKYDGSRKRLARWERGEIDSDQLCKPPNICALTTNRMEIGDLGAGLGPRLKPEDIKITPFERELGAQIEAAYMRDAKPYRGEEARGKKSDGRSKNGRKKSTEHSKTNPGTPSAASSNRRRQRKLDDATAHKLSGKAKRGPAQSPDKEGSERQQRSA